MLRSCLTIFLVIAAMAASAQEVTRAEIKAKKIRRQTVTNKYADGSTDITATEYDSMGNDTATYRGGEKYTATVIRYNAAGKPETAIIYDKEGKEKESDTYTYAPGGNYTRVNRDAAFGLSYHYSYDKAGRLLQYRIPDGTVIKYTYNPKGLLAKMQKIPGDPSETGYTTTYTYTAKNKIATAVTGKSILYYQYGNDGLLKSIGNKAGTYSSSYTYTY